MICGIRAVLEAPLCFHRSPETLHRRSRRLLTTFCSQKVVVISGPTGAGKSRLALELAKRLNGEIISADSVQVYKGLDIGSAKPSIRERQEVPHHLVDILHPSEDYSAGQFYEDARRLTEDVLRRGRVPIITGGTGLYLRWFIYGKPDVPKASSQITIEVNAELEDLQRDGDWNAAVKIAVKAGDQGVQSLATNDWYRLRRRLEILKSSRAPPSAFEVPYNAYKDKFFESSEVEGSGMISSSAENLENRPKDLDYNFLCYFLTTDRLNLYRSIDLRCEDMLLDDGILSEANWLLDLGLLPNTNSATRAIGYRQALDFLLLSREHGSCTPRGFFRFLSEFQTSSRNFAKRQLTWFRNEPAYQWIDASKPMEHVLNFICDAYYDETGMCKVPQSLSIRKDATDRKEARELKAYRTKNRHFIREEDCYSILDWVRRTQVNAAVSTS